MLYVQRKREKNMPIPRECRICISKHRQKVEIMISHKATPLDIARQLYIPYFLKDYVDVNVFSQAIRRHKKHPPSAKDIMEKYIAPKEVILSDVPVGSLEAIALGMAHKKEKQERKKREQDILDPLMADFMAGFSKGEYENLSREIRGKEGIIVFAEKICGLPVTKHKGQMLWLTNRNKMINILRPGNKFGKSLIGGLIHLYHHFTKINLEGTYHTVEEWKKLQYDTLNFGPGYEQAREILRMARDIAQGVIRIPVAFQDQYGVTNKSLLKDWFILKDHADASMLPFVEFITGTKLYGRSYDEMGAAFKMKGLAYISGDEVADIDELWTFTNGTLLPRGVAFPHFSIDYYGTPQPDGHDYMRMIEMAEEDMAKPDWKKNGMFYVQKGSMFENPFLDKQTVETVQKIADPTLREQIINGEYVETGNRYFGYERIQNAVDEKLVQLDHGLPGRNYLISVDFAGGESAWADYTVMGVIDYTDDPYRLVHFKRFKGGEIPIPLQYKLVEDIYNSFKGDNPWHSTSVKLIIDSSALGGKNALAFLKHLNPITFEFSATLKSEMLATLKIVFDGGRSEQFRRKTKTLADGTVIDENPVWGLIRLPNIPELINELQNYKLDDKKIRTDSVMMLGMGIHYLEMRRPKQVRNTMVDFDLLQI